MLQELAHDRAHPDALGCAREAGPDRAGAAGNDVDLYASRARCVEGRDDRLVDDGIDLEHDLRGARGSGVLDLAVDELEEPPPQREGCDEQPAEGVLP